MYDKIFRELYFFSSFSKLKQTFSSEKNAKYLFSSINLKVYLTE